MILFTQQDYFKYTKQMNFGLRETSEKYILDIKPKKKTHQYNDKIFKELLSDKKEFISFISKYLKDNEFCKLSENDIEKYDKEFITSEFRKRESDIIYKITNKDIFIIIEHQSKIDYSMTKRMTEYCIELIRNINKNNKKFINPIICPIVLYTGSTKWNVNYELPESHFGLKTFKYPEFNLIDINNFTKEELLQENSGISKALLFEKINSKEEFKNILNELIKKNLSTQEIEYIQIMFTHSNKIQNFMPQNKELYIEKLKNGDDETMKFEKYFIELLKDEQKKGEERGEKRGERIGIAKTIKHLVQQMIKNNISDEQIMKIANIDKEELEKLKTA